MTGPIRAPWRGAGRMALDLLHPGGTGALPYEPVALGRWLGAVAGVDDVIATTADIAPVHALRDAVRRTALRAVAGAPAGVVDRLAINAAAAVAPPVPALGSDGRAAVPGPVSVPEVLSLLARDAIDLFGGPMSGRVRACGGCGALYLDRSAGGDQRWCSPQRCPAAA
ncbi:ABATE domain-containing protein [Dactylosporangium aurantiacum]|uniref:ABATE domain-containing protein n=1 Tax=Dactylosporangium aurantiacum TaxID=35754 RepID=A0A9Q9IJW6_9ACTN|nr:ABATE domain-containing protein [Dactylosporangium aurantiacum]MDG6102995.1 ABATE domain-containing protein [Dactylosporangium aurantiacum]UWZ57509.1 ABATE domain-containing protein [Dactylosporangium aurantiacum]